MAPLPEQLQHPGRTISRQSKRHSTWGAQPDICDDLADVKSCLGRRKIQSLQDLHEALTEDPCSTSMQHEVQRAEIFEQARIEEIHQHLNDMNVASDELNLAQEDLVTCEQQLQKQVQTWATASAGFAETVGAKLIKKAAPHFREQQRLDAARQRVARASAAFLKAKDAQLSKRKCDRLAANHARVLQEYQDSQGKFDRLRVESPVQSWVLDAVGQYFRAEDDFRMQIGFSEAAVLACHQRISEAKAQYQGALRSLEVLSEEEHKARGSL